MGHFYRLTDGGIKDVSAKSAAGGRPIVCHAGCSACCYEPVYADRREIEHALALLTQEQLGEVTRRTEEWLVKVVDSPELQAHQPNAFAWRALKAPCPLLGADSKCMIYDRRPAPCRMHNATGRWQNCHDDALRPRQKFMYAPEMEAILTTLFLQTFKEIDQDHVGILLARLLLKKKFKTGCTKAVKGEKAALLLKYMSSEQGRATVIRELTNFIPGKES